MLKVKTDVICDSKSWPDRKNKNFRFVALKKFIDWLENPGTQCIRAKYFKPETDLATEENVHPDLSRRQTEERGRKKSA